MSGAGSRHFLRMFCGLAALTLAGCADLDMPAWMPFQGPRSDTVAGVESPRNRIENLRKLSESAKAATPEQRRKISEQLAVSIRDEKDPLIRREIVLALGQYPSPAADRILEAALKDQESFVRIAACQSWGQRLENPRAVVLLSESLKSDVEFDVRVAAARGLGDTKNAAVQAALSEALADPDPAMQYRAVVALEKATGKDFGESVPRWQQYVRGETPAPVTLAERVGKFF